MRLQGTRAWALAFGLIVLPFAASAADLGETPTEPLPDAFHISPSAGVMIFDFSDIDANVIAINENGGSIDISPDHDRIGPVLGGSFGARLGEAGGSVLRLRGSGFYSWYDSDDTVELDEFGGMAWKGLTDGTDIAAAAAAGDPPPAEAAAAAGGLAVFAIAPPATGAAEAGAISDTGAVFVATGHFDVLGIAIDYDEELAYWGGELALAFDMGASENGTRLTPFFGPSSAASTAISKRS